MKPLLKLLKKAKRIDLPGAVVFFSDLHLGDRGPADDFKGNAALFKKVIEHYTKLKFTPVLVGDIEELWQFDRDQIKEAYPELVELIDGMIRIQGNHDKERPLPEALVVNNILVFHGHQADWLNSRFWRLARFLVRYAWSWLEMIGVPDPKSDRRHAAARDRLRSWAKESGYTLVCGHTHRQEHDKTYWNIGSGIGPGIECIEFSYGKLYLRSWRSP